MTVTKITKNQKLLSTNLPISGNTTWWERDNQFRHGLTPPPFFGQQQNDFFLYWCLPLWRAVTCGCRTDIPPSRHSPELPSTFKNICRYIFWFSFTNTESETSRPVYLKSFNFALSNHTCILLALSLTQNLCKSASVSSNCSIIPSSLRAMVEPRCLCGKCRTKGVQRCKIQYLMISWRTL